MIDYLFNVGLLRSTRLSDGSRIERKDARRVIGAAALKHGGLVTASALHTSDTEPTLVVRVAAPTPFAAEAIAREVAEALDQEAVAYAVEDRAAKRGRLVGPLSYLWGAFNPEFFLLLDGRRAAVPATAAQAA